MIFNNTFRYLNKLSIKFDRVIMSNNNLNDDRIFSLTFHSVHQDKDTNKLHNYLNPNSSISVSQLENFIEFFLSKGVQFINSRDFSKKKLANTNVILSFDDGYFNNHLLIDIVNKYNIPIEVFISTKYVEEQKLFWWDVFYNRNKNPEKFKFLNHSEILSRSEILFQNNMFSDLNRPFNISELIEFSKNKNILIGNHSNSHIICNYINLDNFLDDVILAQKKLSNWLGYIPISFAFPNGNAIDSEYDKLIKLGLLYNYTVYPNYFYKKNITQNEFLPRFMFGTNSDIKDTFDSILKDGITLALYKFIYQFKKSRYS